MSIEPVVTCGCGRSYDLTAWRKLGIPVYMESGLAGVSLELRRCECGSHRGIHTCTDDHRTYIDDAAVEKVEIGLCAATSCDVDVQHNSAWCGSHQPCSLCHFGAGSNEEHDCGRCAACRDYFPAEMLEDFGSIGHLCSGCYDAHPHRRELAQADMGDDS